MKSPLLLSGIGLRPQHHVEFLEKCPQVAWVEVHSENFFTEGGKLLHDLEMVRKDYPVSLHGVSMSIGSADEINWSHMQKLKQLIDHINPCLISDHLSWSSIEGRYLHDLLPLPFTEECLLHLIVRIQQIQEYLTRQILIENISQYVDFNHSTLSEPDFLNALATQSECGILLDINNIYVSATNLGNNPYRYIDQIEAHLVQEIHLAGFTSTMIDEKEVLVDSHNRAIVPAVWDLYRYALNRIGRKPTIIEWDADIPQLGTLYLEAYRAEQILRETHAINTLAN